ncbi:ras guanyl-releasing protein 3 isoform X10 [Piliocolobus tephrosceles]|uniref:ras guanyl-releasing protein 3 isoform X10 n=1 Tax=Piliocolobus tephrosceles TaxID=591936 RepID=UPI000E6B2A40|nr:ras guanyl-releasing protein 3 isoform X10 [Piliocolobus tephrosceles]
MGSSGLGKAATLDELLHTCIEMFDDNGELNNSYLPRIVLLMHRWYLSSTELAEKLLCMYRNATGESCNEFRLKICYFMRYWILKFPAEFNLDLGLIRMTEEFREVASQLGYEKHVSLIDISSIPSYDWMRRVTQRKKVSKKGKACLLFDHLEPIELAEHLTFLEHKSFRRISFTDYQSYVIHGCLENNPTLERSIALFNGISKWVQLMVLSKPTPQQRAEVITKFINVAKKLLQLKNFNTLMAVVGGLSHSSISRLKETHSHLSSEVTKLSLDLYHTEDDIYKLSLVLEPRNSKSPTSPTTPNKPVVPLEWALGVMPKPDPTVINKHIRKLVESVFRNYDHDHDGYISQEDFESIAANFPFLDSFCVLDKDQDGLISKDEMMAYFLRAKSQLHCKMGPGFIHNFQEMTYLKPTFCEHCAGFLWGIIKQGYKCKDCGANCHKQCKDLLVLACRRFARAPSLSSGHGSLPGSPSLPPAQDEVFEFPGVTAGHRDLDSRAITLVTGSSRKISVRLQRATTSQATQTEPVWSEAGWGDSGSHTFPKMKSKFHDKAAKDKGFAKWENEKPRVHAGVDVVDRGTDFEPDQDEGEETRQDGEKRLVRTEILAQQRKDGQEHQGLAGRRTRTGIALGEKDSVAASI